MSKHSSAHEQYVSLLFESLDNELIQEQNTITCFPDSIASLSDRSIIRCATLHNEDYCIEKDVQIGDIISIRKAGDVIPEVVRPVLERRTGNEKAFAMIDKCPICNEKIVRKET